VIKLTSLENPEYVPIPVVNMNGSKFPLVPMSTNPVSIPLEMQTRLNPEIYETSPNPGNESWGAPEYIGLGAGLVVVGTALGYGVYRFCEWVGIIEEKVEKLEHFQVAMTKDTFR